ncbi:MAG: AAA family ATPase, partial [Ruminococcus flavefaciens]|nr:AAA family ATPase [Ruminococcus flavefaciens]
MYFSKEFLIKLYSKMKTLYTGIDINAQGGTQYCSEIKYFLATDKFIRLNDKKVDYSNNEDKRKFCKYVGDVVLLGKKTDSLFTKNFANSIEKNSETSDFHIGSNFFSTNVCSTAKKAPMQEFTWPSRDAVLLKIKYPDIEIHNKGYENFFTNYLSASFEKCAILALWLFRFEFFSSKDTITNEMIKFLSSNYSSNLINSINLNEVACKNKIKDLLLEVSTSENFSEILEEDIMRNERLNSIVSPLPLPHNRIIFGAPGTGKSHLLEQERFQYFGEAHYERVTFHPNYTYSQFVGAYKPIALKNTEGKEDITYAFVPGPFVRVLVKSMQNPSENFLLVIEEINRANVAAVFGDVFQLLDRDESGKSEYPIDAGEDLKNYLKEQDISLDDGKIVIPANMYIWATMNSADQGVMPLDAAFKRRWEFEYIGIDENENQVAYYEIPNAKNSDGDSTDFSFVNWNDFRKTLNEKLKNLQGTTVNEDKLLGPFFIGKQSLETAKEKPEDFVRLFKSKVLMYLYEDVCKMNPRALFTGIADGGRLHYSDVCAAFDK